MTDPIPFEKWRVWIGTEIEGNTSLLHISTVFIRHFTEQEEAIVLHQLLKASSVWFCKEFTDYAYIERILNELPEGYQVKVEVTLESLPELPQSVRDRAVLFLKLGNVQLKDGDYVCVGATYSDESLCIGSGNRVNREMYNNDVRIL